MVQLSRGRPWTVAAAAAYGCMLIVPGVLVGLVAVASAWYIMMQAAPARGLLSLAAALLMTCAWALLLGYGVRDSWRGRSMGRWALTVAFVVTALSALTLNPILVVLGMGAIPALAALFTDASRRWFAER